MQEAYLKTKLILYEWKYERIFVLNCKSIILVASVLQNNFKAQSHFVLS